MPPGAGNGSFGGFQLQIGGEIRDESAFGQNRFGDARSAYCGNPLCNQTAMRRKAEGVVKAEGGKLRKQQGLVELGRELAARGIHEEVLADDHALPGLFRPFVTQGLIGVIGHFEVAGVEPCVPCA